MSKLALPCRVVVQHPPYSVQSKPSLATSLESVGPFRDFVNKSPRFSDDRIPFTTISPFATFSRIWWCRTSICFTNACCFEFSVRLFAPSLSPHRVTPPSWSRSTSDSTCICYPWGLHQGYNHKLQMLHLGYIQSIQVTVKCIHHGFIHQQQSA